MVKLKFSIYCLFPFVRTYIDVNQKIILYLHVNLTAEASYRGENNL